MRVNVSAVFHEVVWFCFLFAVRFLRFGSGVRLEDTFEFQAYEHASRPINGGAPSK